MLAIIQVHSLDCQTDFGTPMVDGHILQPIALVNTSSACHLTRTTVWLCVHAYERNAPHEPREPETFLRWYLTCGSWVPARQLNVLWAMLGALTFMTNAFRSQLICDATHRGFSKYTSAMYLFPRTENLLISIGFIFFIIMQLKLNMMGKGVWQ